MKRTRLWSRPVIWLLTIHGVSGQGSNCSFQPISIPFGDVSLPNNASTRGAALSLGTPGQEISFVPSVILNNTYAFPQNSNCSGGITEAACITTRGGYFLPEDSNTFQQFSNVVMAGADIFENMTTGIWARDTMTLESNLSLTDYPFEVPSEEIVTTSAITQAVLGLAQNSTVLSMLKSAGIIGSSTWSFWWGLAGATTEAQMDGSLVLGGYDAAKIKDITTNHTAEFVDPTACESGMTVTINELLLNFPNGSSPNLLDPSLGSSPIVACICPTCPTVMSLAMYPYYNRFEAWTGTYSIGRSLGINFYTMMYPPDAVYQGDFTITLDTGLSIRIPNSQLVLPDMTISDTGAIVANTSVRDVMIYRLQDINENNIPRLGAYFLTAAYLMVDQDTRTYTMWEANPTTDIDLVAVADTQSASQCNTSTVVGPVPSSNNSTPLPPSTSKPSGKGRSLSGGAIAGITIGVILSLVVAGVLLMRRRHVHRRKFAQIVQDPVVGQGGTPKFGYPISLPQSAPFEMYGGPPPELRGDSLPPQELWAGPVS